MIKNIFNGFRQLEMSKKLTIIVLIFWILLIIADIVFYMIFNKDINIIVDYVNTAFLVILGSYFGKSMVENISKIRVSDVFKSNSEQKEKKV